MDALEEKPLRLPTNIQVKTSDDSIDHYIIDGNILKKSKTCILLEETTLWKKSSEGEYTPSLLYDKPEGTRPYVVILLDKHLEYDARFFDNFEDALRYYSCFFPIETENGVHG